MHAAVAVAAVGRWRIGGAGAGCRLVKAGLRRRRVGLTGSSLLSGLTGVCRVKTLGAMDRSPTFPKLESPVTVPASEMRYVPARLDMAAGRAAVERAVREGFLRPFDIDSAEIEPPRPLWVPFWRVEVSAEGFHVNFENVTLGSKGPAIPIPTGGARYKELAVVIPARTSFPYEAKLPSLFARVSGTPPLEIPAGELVANPSVETLTANDAEIVDADVDRARAESMTTELMLRSVSPTHAFYSTYKPKIRSAELVLYPVYYARYTYSGEARRRPSEELFVAVSGTTGAVISAKHPSVARAVAAKVRRYLSFDLRR